MSKLFRVLIIDDQKEVTDRVSNICQKNLSASLKGQVKVEVDSLYVEIISTKQGEFQISDGTIETLIKLSSKEFDYIFTDFGFVANNTVYESLPLDEVGEIDPTSLSGKVFTPADLVLKAKEFIEKKKNKATKKLQSNFLEFKGGLSLYSYWDKRFSKVYHSLGERAHITANVFPNASFDKLHDVKDILFDNNDAYKTNEHHYAFLKCHFISNLIRDLFLFKDSIQVEKRESFLTKFKFFLSSWKANGIGSFNHWKICGFWIFYLGFVILAPLKAISTPSWIQGWFKVHSDYYTLVLVIILSLLVIVTGTFIYTIDIVLSSKKSDSEYPNSSTSYVAGIISCFSCVVIGIWAISDIVREENIVEIINDTEFYSFLIFFIFTLIDWFMIHAKVGEQKFYLSKSNKAKYIECKHEISFISKQLYFIDIPVLIGVALIFAYTHLAHSFFFTTDFPREKFVIIFTAGSIAMHIFFSQFIFVILNTRNAFQEIKK